MRKRICQAALIAAALALLVLFAAALTVYARPMEDQVYDLSLVPQTDAVPEDWEFSDKGWTVFTQEGDDVQPLIPSDTGGFSGLTESGQTFYLSRVLDETLNAPTLQLGPSESAVAVFLDDRLLYSDVELEGATVGSLRLPMLPSYRDKLLEISLPADYRGKTLTIAQATWPVDGVPMEEVLVFPLNVILYCGYAYESGLIAESFRTAIPAVLALAAALALLAVLVWQTTQRSRPDLGLLWAAAALFCCMVSVLALAPFFSRYVGEVQVDVVRLARLFTLAALLAFLASRAGTRRAILWVLTGLYTLSVLLSGLLDIKTEGFVSDLTAFLYLSLPELLGLAALLAALVMGVVFWRHDGRFYDWFIPPAAAGILVAAIWLAFTAGPKEALRQAARCLVSLTPGYLLWPLMSASLIAATLAALASAVRWEIAQRTEMRALADREQMAQESYRVLSQQHQEILMLRHDMKKHLLSLRGIIQEHRGAAYLDSLIGQVGEIRSVADTGNAMLDIILNSHLTAAQDAGISVEMERMQAPEQLPLSDAELSSLMINILDNAVAGAQASGAERPYLRVECHVKNDFFVFNCENSASRERGAEETKKEKPMQMHGLGTKIIRQIMARYGDLLRIETGTDFYRVTLALPLLTG